MYSKKVRGNIAKACTYNVRVSVKNTKQVCKAIRGLYLNKAKRFLEDVLKQKKSIGGKYYTKSTAEILRLIKSAEKNAEFKNFDLDRLYIAHIAALDGTTMFRRRHKRSLGMRMKTANLEVILKERGGKIEPKDKEESKEPRGEVEKKLEAKEEKKAPKKSDSRESKQNVDYKSKNTKN